jgi:hypothetical protein
MPVFSSEAARAYDETLSLKKGKCLNMERNLSIMICVASPIETSQADKIYKLIDNDLKVGDTSRLDRSKVSVEAVELIINLNPNAPDLLDVAGALASLAGLLLMPYEKSISQVKS